MAFRFEHLEIWKESIFYANEIYLVVKTFPREELFALSDQLRRSSSSVSTNIAEGAGSRSKKDFSHFLDIAIKSVYETVSLLYLATEQNYISNKKRLELYELADKLVRKIKSFQNRLIDTQ